MMMSITPCLLLLALTHVNAIVPNGIRNPIVPSTPRDRSTPPVIQKITLLNGEPNVSQSTVFDGHKAEYAIDGNTQTFSRTTVNSTELPYLLIDLQKFYYVDYIKITNLHGKEYPLQDLLITVDEYTCRSYAGRYIGKSIKVKCREPVQIGRGLRISLRAEPTRQTYVSKNGDEIVGYDPAVHSEEVERWDDGEEITIDEYDQILNISEVEVWGYEA